MPLGEVTAVLVRTGGEDDGALPVMERQIVFMHQALVRPASQQVT